MCVFAKNQSDNTAKRKLYIFFLKCLSYTSSSHCELTVEKKYFPNSPMTTETYSQTSIPPFHLSFVWSLLTVFAPVGD